MVGDGDGARAGARVSDRVRGEACVRAVAEAGLEPGAPEGREGAGRGREGLEEDDEDEEYLARPHGR